MKNALLYIEHLQKEGKAINTLKTYQYHLASFYSWINQNGLHIEELTPKIFVSYKEDLLETGRTPRTVNAMLSCVRGYYDFLTLEEIVEINPVSRALHIRMRIDYVTPLNPEQIKLFENYIDQMQENLRAGFYLMLSTGMRVGEVAALKKGDFRVLEGKLLVNIVNAKWESDREIPVLSGKAALIIFNYVESVDSYTEQVFRVTKRTFQTYASKFKSQTGIDFSCHVLRHTVATELSNSGVKIQQIQHLLGHKTYNMTQHYVRKANNDIMSIAPTIWQGEKLTQ